MKFEDLCKVFNNFCRDFRVRNLCKWSRSLLTVFGEQNAEAEVAKMKLEAEREAKRQKEIEEKKNKKDMADKVVCLCFSNDVAQMSLFFCCADTARRAGKHREKTCWYQDCGWYSQDSACQRCHGHHEDAQTAQEETWISHWSLICCGTQS